MHNFKELIIWQKSMDLVTDVYKYSTSLPDDQKYGLTSQLLRSAVSIPSNIAEGSGRNSDKEFVRFLNISNGSCCELETQILIARNIQFLPEGIAKDLLNQLKEVQKMNHALRLKFE